jgi:hypothetical protein
MPVSAPSTVHPSNVLHPFARFEMIHKNATPIATCVIHLLIANVSEEQDGNNPVRARVDDVSVDILDCHLRVSAATKPTCPDKAPTVTLDIGHEPRKDACLDVLVVNLVVAVLHMCFRALCVLSRASKADLTAPCVTFIGGVNRIGPNCRCVTRLRPNSRALCVNWNPS